MFEGIANLGRQRRTTRALGTPANVPSGIAQLRQSSDHAPPPSDPMNLDDFIHNDNVGTPAGLALTPTPETMRQAEERSVHSTAAAIPIKTRKEPAPSSSASQQLAPQSVPVAAHQRVQDEFGSLPRHPRKTSIDETGLRVSLRAVIIMFRAIGVVPFVQFIRALRFL